jgi:hypothetical protein
MAIEWKTENNNLIVFEVSGQLGKKEHQQILSEIEAIIIKLGHIKILVLVKDFTGWEAAKGWEENSTDHIDPYINKFAIVGDEKWRDLAEVFTLKGLRPVPIEYFPEDQEQQAREWLDR